MEIKNFDDLLKKETLLQEKVELSKNKIEELVTPSYHVKGFIDSLKASIFKNKGNSSTDTEEIRSFQSTPSPWKPILDVSIDLVYESLSLLLVNNTPAHEPKKNKVQLFKQILKSVLDLTYLNYKSDITETISQKIEEKKGEKE